MGAPGWSDFDLNVVERLRRRDLVAEAAHGDWKKAETFRLGHENSEDALS